MYRIEGPKTLVLGLRRIDNIDFGLRQGCSTDREQCEQR